MVDMAQLHYVLRGISRSTRGNARPLRLPITTDILVRLFHAWKAFPDQYEANLLWAAATLGFFGFLRAGEFTAVSGSGQVPLTLGYVRVDSHVNLTFLAVTLRASKTDPFGAVHTLYLGRTNSRDLPSGCRTRIHCDSTTGTRTTFYSQGWNPTHTS